MGFPEQTMALQNKAVDAALPNEPSAYLAEKLGAGVRIMGDDVIYPNHQIATVFYSGQFIKSKPEAARKFMRAYLRGVRDYCQAYHNGPNRKEFIEMLARTGAERRSEILNDPQAWPARDPNGKINIASMLDMQAWYTANKMSTANFPAERVVDSTYADYAAKKLGPFVLENKASTLPGCR